MNDNSGEREHRRRMQVDEDFRGPLKSTRSILLTSELTRSGHREAQMKTYCVLASLFFFKCQNLQNNLSATTFQKLVCLGSSSSGDSNDMYSENSGHNA